MNSQTLGEPATEDESVVLKMDRRNAVVTASLASCFVAVGVSMIIDGGGVALVTGAVSVVFSGAGLLILILAIIRPRALPTIDRSGVRFGGMSRSARRSIPWEASAGGLGPRDHRYLPAGYANAGVSPCKGNFIKRFR